MKGHKFVRACDECLEEGVECVKMVSLAWIVNQRIKIHIKLCHRIKDTMNNQTRRLQKKF